MHCADGDEYGEDPAAEKTGKEDADKDACIEDEAQVAKEDARGAEVEAREAREDAQEAKVELRTAAHGGRSEGYVGQDGPFFETFI